jgi:hypothetical protein
MLLFGDFKSGDPERIPRKYIFPPWVTERSSHQIVRLYLVVGKYGTRLEARGLKQYE